MGGLLAQVAYPVPRPNQSSHWWSLFLLQHLFGVGVVLLGCGLAGHLGYCGFSLLNALFLWILSTVFNIISVSLFLSVCILTVA